MIYFLIPVIPLVTSASWSKPLLRIVFYSSLLISFFIQFRGATTEALWNWNMVPSSTMSLAKLWDWGDPQFLRGSTWWGSWFPPILGSSPAAIHLYCTTGDQQHTCKTSVDIFDRRWQAFRWEAKAPSGIKVVPIRGQNQFESSHLTIQLVKSEYPPGIYNLGEVIISGVRPGKIKFTDSMPILIILHAGPPVQQ
jgi:hypothetical protein